PAPDTTASSGHFVSAPPGGPAAPAALASSASAAAAVIRFRNEIITLPLFLPLETTRERSAAFDRGPVPHHQERRYLSGSGPLLRGPSSASTPALRRRRGDRSVSLPTTALARTARGRSGSACSRTRTAASSR